MITSRHTYFRFVVLGAVLCAFLCMGGYAADAPPLGPYVSRVDKEALKALPRLQIENIKTYIRHLTSLTQVTKAGTIHWRTRSIDLVDLVRAVSPVFEDTYLCAMRLVVIIMSDRTPPTIKTTVCQTTLVFKDHHYFPPTIGCDPITFGPQFPKTQNG